MHCDEFQGILFFHCEFHIIFLLLYFQFLIFAHNQLNNEFAVQGK